MKKLLALLLALIFVFSFAACGSGDQGKETTVAATTKAPAPKTPETAAKTVSDFFDQLNANSFLINKNNLTTEDELSIIILDAIISNSVYEILDTVKKDDNAFNVNVKLSIPDTDAALKLIEEAVSTFDEKYPDATNEESIVILKELINQSFADPSISKTPVEQVVTVEYIDGNWVVDNTSDELLSALKGIFLSAF